MMLCNDGMTYCRKYTGYYAHSVFTDLQSRCLASTVIRPKVVLIPSFTYIRIRKTVTTNAKKTELVMMNTFA